MVDEKVVQAGEASEGALSTTEGAAETKTASEPTPPLTEERITKLIEERARQIVAVERERIRQSSRDIARKEVEDERRRRGLAETELSSFKTSFDTLDEDTRKDVELARLRGKEKYYETVNEEEKEKQNQEAFMHRFSDSRIAHLEELEIDPTDKRVDWATDATDLLTLLIRFDASVAKILKANAKTASERRAQEAKDIEAKVRKEAGLDSVVTSNAPGSGARKPTLEELRASSPEETDKKVKEGTWLIPGWR